MYSSLQVKFGLSYILIIAAVLLLLNTYPLRVSQDLVFRSKEATLESSVSVMVYSLSDLDHLTEENVAQAMAVVEETGMSRILVTDEEEQVKFSVEDDGEGIKASVLPKMFEGRMEAENPAGSDAKRNMGIGLSVCMTIVKAHKGSMKAENREEGGARVMFWLPKGMESENGN